MKYQNSPVNRIYQLDRECYVLYMGEPGRMHRPFLRLGNSQSLPAELKKYIGQVVLSDRLTGNCFIEEDCLDTSTTEPTNYVGSPELTKAIVHFVGNKRVSKQLIHRTQRRQYKNGANVVFYVNGNLQVFLGDTNLFDLFEREGHDHHHIRIIQQIEDRIQQTRDIWRAKELRGNGFIPLKNNSCALFQDGVILPVSFGSHGLKSISSAMFPPSLVRRFGGQSDKEAILNIIKWHNSQKNTIEFIQEHDKKEETKIEENKFLNYLKTTNMHIHILKNQFIPEYLKLDSWDQNLTFTSTPLPVNVSTLNIPEGGIWIHSSIPILPGVPYFLPSDATTLQLDSKIEQLMSSLSKEFILKLKTPFSPQTETKKLMRNQNIDEESKLAILMWMWNQLLTRYDNQDSYFNILAEHISILHNSNPIPVQVILVNLAHGWALSFSAKAGSSRQTIMDWNLARETINEISNFVPDARYFSTERKYLMRMLHSLLPHEKSRVEYKKISPTSKPNKTIQTATQKNDLPTSQVRSNNTGGTDAIPLKQAKKKKTPKFTIILLLILATGMFALLAGRGLFTKRSDISSERNAKKSSTLPNEQNDVNNNQENALSTLPNEQNDVNNNQENALSTLPDEQNDVNNNQENALSTLPDEQNDVNNNQGKALSTLPDEQNDVNNNQENALSTLPDEQNDVSNNQGNALSTLPDEQNDVNNNQGNALSTLPDEQNDVNNNQENMENSQGSLIVDEPIENSSLVIIEWGLPEILFITNWICYNSGYEFVGIETILERNPDWIYSGNNLTLPNKTNHKVQEGETIWGIAHAFLDHWFENSGLNKQAFRERIKNLNFDDTI